MLIEVVHVVDVQHLPAVGLEALRGVIGEREIGRPVDRDVVVVVEADQLAELEVSGEAGGLVRDALHQVAVAADEVRVVIDDVVTRLVEHGREVRFGHRHADRVADALAERARGRLDAGRVAVLGVSRRPALPLPELLEVLERQVVAAQVQAAIEQHRRVAGRQHEPVAIGPCGVGRVVSHGRA